MKWRLAIFVLPLIVPGAACGQQIPPTSVTVPAKVIGHGSGTHSLSCLQYIPSDLLKRMQIIRATFSVIVGPDGSVKGASLRESTGNTEVDTDLIQCAMNWQYVPATVDGKPVEWTSTSYQVLQSGAPGPPPTPNALAGLTRAQLASIDNAFNEGRKSSKSCFADVSGGRLDPVTLTLTFDGGNGTISIASLAGAFAGTETENCVRKSFEGLRIDTFDGPPRTETYGYAPRF